MRIRHRIPSIFNLSMVDVLCCALGCVILLWLLNLKDARQRALMASETDLALTAARSDKDQLRLELEEMARRIAGLCADLNEAAKRESDTRARLAAAERREQDAVAAREQAKERIALLSNERQSARMELDKQTDLRIDLEKRLQTSIRRA